jgi:nicotinamidase-related amidase
MPELILNECRPGPFALPVAHAALVIIDMQRDFVEPGGFGETLGNKVEPLQAIIPALQGVLSAWRKAGALVIHTREGHKPDLSDCPPAKLLRGKPSARIGDVGPMGRILIQGEHGHGIVDALAPTESEWVIDKPGKGMFYNTGLDERLRAQRITHLVFTGVTTEVCVQTSMREANDRGYECLALADCTESYFPEFKRATLDMLCAQGGIVGWVADSSGELVRALSGRQALV